MAIEKHLNGLNAQQVEESRVKHGVNILTPPPKPSLWVKFFENFKDPMIRILLVALALSVGIAIYEFVTTDHGMEVFFEPVGIFVAIMLATGIGFALEVNANKKFEILNQVNDDVAVKVIRNGVITQVARKDIVVGDIVILGTGDEIPADGVLLDSVALSVNESTLTGEPLIRKSHRKEDFKDDVTYPTNHVMRGTTVVEGTGTMEVTAVGDATEYGKVYEAAQIDTGVKTPLTLQLEKLGKVISWGSYSVGCLIIIGRLLMFDWGGADMLGTINYLLGTLMLAITVIVVSVPEGLPMSVTLSLALSMRRMLASNNLVRKMHACETMGATTVICTDKTGTLTQNQMRVYQTQYYPLGESQKLGDDELSNVIKEGISVNSTAFLECDQETKKMNALGNPTEGALLLWLNDNGVDYLKLRENAKVIQQLPFHTQRKYMATVVDSPLLGKRVLYVKGAPEIVLGLCAKVAGDVKPETINAQLLGYQQKAMRTLAIAYVVLDDNQEPIHDNQLTVDNLIFIGITAIADPVRAEVPDAIRNSISAGIRVTIVTGDTPGTAKEIGRQVGLWNDEVDGEENHISGPDFAALSEEEAAKIVLKLKIMSRARPTDKSRLVRLLQEAGEVVAVTGDGTNDAPALNAAQVGLSMGDGTSVAKEASDITIMDNSFASITKAVMWGRSLYQNIQRFVLFQLVVNIVACLIVVIGAFTGTQSPLTVTQMLWVNLIMDTFAALAFASLPPSVEVMKNKPRRSTDFILSRKMIKRIFSTGVLFVVILFGLMQCFRNNDIESLSYLVSYPGIFFHSMFEFGGNGTFTPYELSMFFSIFVFFQIWNLFNAKAFDSGHTAFFNMKGSKVFFMVVIGIIVGQYAIVTLGGDMFSVVPLAMSDWGYIILLTSLIMLFPLVVKLIAMQIRKK
ncbi:MAG: calcium-translocating P-type ATPase, PMCA-type [Muribaculaceae bacterium]|nr:calcium-translocating P-type ATPase, PMCA-type [Muribaculaceae bacterium]